MRHVFLILLFAFAIFAGSISGSKAATDHAAYAPHHRHAHHLS